MAHQRWLQTTGAAVFCAVLAGGAPAQLFYLPGYYDPGYGTLRMGYQNTTWNGELTIGSIVGNIAPTPSPPNVVVFQSSPPTDLASYQTNYDEGHTAGYAAGYSSGFATGSDRGTTQGSAKGNSDGSLAGRDAAYQPAYDAAYNTSFATGRADGFNNGICGGFEAGFDSALAAAVQEAASGSISMLGGELSITINGYIGGITISSGTLMMANNNWGGISGSMALGSAAIMSTNTFSVDWAKHYFDEGYTDGQKTGLVDGDAAGFDATYSTAYAAAYDRGFQIGSAEGTAQGTTDGGSAGYSAGNDAGWNNGYGLGFDAGVRYFLSGGSAANASAAAAQFSADVTAVPEPTGIALLALALSSAFLRRFRSA